MKFKKFGKALLMSALSAGVVLSVTSCVQSYTVGFLYVTGTETAQSTGTGIISGFKIDHNTGTLTTINGLPISSGGANPVRAVLLTGSRFLYVLNRGTTSSGGADCTTNDPCQNANITQFAVGANGILTPQNTFYTQGKNPFRLISDSTGNYLYVLEHDSPASPADPYCTQEFGSGTCGDITAFSVNSTTGRLQLVENTQLSASGTPVPYFPVPANPVDFVLSSSYVLTLSGISSGAYPYTGGTSVFPYTYASGSGQLTVSQNTIQPLNITQGTAIISSGGHVYVLDNESITYTPTGSSSAVTAPSQILPFNTGTNGALQALTGGIVPDDVAQSNPIYLLTESKGSFVYVANQGDLTAGPNPQSGLSGWIVDKTTQQLTPEISGSPWGTGSGPQCLVEDPSNQYVYTANFNDSTVTGRSIDQSAGSLRNLSKPGATTLPGPATWCLVDGRTD